MIRSIIRPAKRVCSNCGAKVSGGAKVCPKCKRPLLEVYKA